MHIEYSFHRTLDHQEPAGPSPHLARIKLDKNGDWIITDQDNRWVNLDQDVVKSPLNFDKETITTFYRLEAAQSPGPIRETLERYSAQQGFEGHQIRNFLLNSHALLPERQN